MKAKFFSLLFAVAVSIPAAAQTIYVPVNFAAVVNVQQAGATNDGFLIEPAPVKYAVNSQNLLERLGVYQSGAVLTLAVNCAEVSASYFCATVNGAEIQSLTNNLRFRFQLDIDCKAVRAGRADLLTGIAEKQSIVFPVTITCFNAAGLEFQMRGLFTATANEKADASGLFYTSKIKIQMASLVGAGNFLGQSHFITGKASGSALQRIPFDL